MTTPTPSQQLADDISELQSKISDLQEGIRLTDTRNAIGDLQTTITGMPQQLAALRQRGYIFEKDLESQAATFIQQWNTLSPNLLAQINSLSSSLEASLRPLEMQLSQASAQINHPAVARPLIDSLKTSLSTLEDKAAAAEEAVEGMYKKLQSTVDQVEAHLEDVDWVLSQLAEASFQLLPTEGGIAAVKAVWCKTGKEQKGDPEGIFYLTDQRILFEQKEDVTTKKVLFIATEKRKVQNLQLEVPVSMIDKIETSKQGLLKNEDHIEIRFISGAPVEKAHFHIWQDNAAWQALINRAKSKDFDNGRAVAIDQAAKDKVKAAPSQCPSCGGNLTKPVLRGQDSITCEYCGFVIRL